MNVSFLPEPELEFGESGLVLFSIIAAPCLDLGSSGSGHSAFDEMRLD